MQRKFLFILIPLLVAELTFAKENRLTEFQKAIESDSIKKIEKLIKKSSEDERVDGFMLAVQSKKKDCVSVFLKSGLNVDTLDKDQNTPLILACSINDNDEIVEFLLENGANINAKNINEITPLLEASRHINNIKVLKVLLKFGVDVNLCGFSQKKSPLMIAFLDNSFSYIKCLLESGVATEVKNYKGETAIFYAVRRQDIDLIKFLLDKGADINVISDEAETPLLYAVKTGNVEVANFLVQNKAKVDGKLLFTACRENKVEIIKFLLNNGVGINTKNENGDTALIQGTKENNTSIVSFLIENKANVNLTDKNNHTALYYSIIESENTEIENILRKSGAKLTTAEERFIFEEKEREKNEKKRELAKKRQSPDNFYYQVLHRSSKGIPLEYGDEFTIDAAELEIIDRDRDSNGYIYLVTFWTSIASDAISRAYSYVGKDTSNYCFYIRTKKEMGICKKNFYPYKYNSIITNENSLRIVCTGIGQYQQSFKDVDAYIFTLLEEK